MKKRIVLKEYTELKENMLIQKEEKIKSLENHIEKIELRANKEIQTTVNYVSSKLKNEYDKYLEYLELKGGQADLSAEESSIYLEHVLKKTFSILKKNGFNME